MLVVVVVVVLVNVAEKIRDKAGSREQARARHIQYNLLFADSVNL